MDIVYTECTWDVHLIFECRTILERTRLTLTPVSVSVNNFAMLTALKEIANANAKNSVRYF